MRVIFGENILGVGVDEQTRCAHWKTDLDIIAIKFKCCGEWFPCFDCHAAVADHKPQTWPVSDCDVKAILCGACGYQLSITEYFGCDSLCPKCGSSFNPGCSNHSHLYFE